MSRVWEWLRPAVYLGQHRLFDSLDRDLELRGFPRHLLPMIVLWEGQFKCAPVARTQADDLLFEVGKQAALPEHGDMVAAAAALELLTLVKAAVVDRDAISGLCSALRGLVTHALLAQDLDSLGHFLVACGHHRPLDRDGGQVSDLDLGVDLEGSTELDLVIRLGSFRLETREPRNSQVLLAHRLAEGLLQRVP